MLGIALDLDGTPFARAYSRATTRRALPASARKPRGDAGDLVLRRHDVGNDALGRDRRTRACRDRRRRSTEELEKRPTTDVFDERGGH
jgi:hypothetical protein